MRKKIIIGVLAVAAGVVGLACYGPRRAKELRLPGTVEVQEVRLASKEGGRVTAVKVVEGQTVEPGQVVVEFETAEPTARRDKARARVDAARASSTRQTSVRGRKRSRRPPPRRTRPAPS